MSDTFDAIVVGGDVNGLTAAAYLARAGRKTLLVEPRNELGGDCENIAFSDGFVMPVVHEVHALDPQVMRDLKLARFGFRLAARDLPAVVIGGAQQPLVVSRDAFLTSRNLGGTSRVDSEAWGIFRYKALGLARALRAMWWSAEQRVDVDFDQILRLPLTTWLESKFESDALKTALAFEILESGCSPAEIGSTLQLHWRLAQEAGGLQAACAFPAGGPAKFAEALVHAARAAGVTVRTGVRVDRIITLGCRVAGVVLANGEEIFARMVHCSASRAETFASLLPTAIEGIAHSADSTVSWPAPGIARLAFGLDALPEFASTNDGKARYFLIDRLASLVSAHNAAQFDQMPDELPLELVFPSIFDPSFAPIGQHLMSVTVYAVPRTTDGSSAGMRESLVAKVLAAIARRVPEITRHVKASHVLMPGDLSARYGMDATMPAAIRLCTTWADRIMTPVDGLYMCGRTAEPSRAISGRAGRIAAEMALQRGLV